jgi:hypothetical protein
MSAMNVIDMIKEGVMIGPASEQAAEMGGNTRTGKCLGKPRPSFWCPNHLDLSRQTR